MILSKKVISRDGLLHTVNRTIKCENMRRNQAAARGLPVQFPPIRILVPQGNFTRGQVAGVARLAGEEASVKLFTSFVKSEGVDYWVIQEDTPHVHTGT